MSTSHPTFTCRGCGNPNAPCHWTGYEPHRCVKCGPGQYHKFIPGCIIVQLYCFEDSPPWAYQVPLNDQIRMVNEAIEKKQAIQFKPDLHYFKNLDPPIEFQCIDEYGTFYPWDYGYILDNLQRKYK